MLRTFQPKSKKVRLTKHGFMYRMSTSTGRNILNRRRHKGRKRIAVI